MKKNQIIKTLLMITAAATVLCGCTFSYQGEDGPTSVYVAVNSNDGETSHDGESGQDGETSQDGAGEDAGENSLNNTQNGDSVGGEDAQETVKSCEEIYEEVAGAVELQSPMIVPDNFVANYGIDFSTVEDSVFAMSEMSTSVETIAIFKAGDEASRESIIAALEMYADGKRAEMENYLPEQFDIVDQSSVKTSGEYVYLVISENAETIEEIITDCLP